MRTSRERRRPGLLTYLATALLVGAALTMGAPAATAATPSPTAQVATVMAAADAPASDHSASSWTYSCFGHKGTFADSSVVMKIDWSYDVPECYGVAPNGTIWHIWQGASKWYEMPGNGLATNMANLIDHGNGDRTVQVYVSWGSWQYYCQQYLYDAGWVGSWYRC